jgi:hypothetical protein
MKKIMGKSWEYHGNIMGISINYIGDDWGEGMIRCFHPQHMDRKNMNKSRILMIDVELFSEIHGMIYMI